MGLMHEFEAPSHWAIGNIKYTNDATRSFSNRCSDNLTTQNMLYKGSQDNANVIITIKTIFVTCKK